MLRKRGQVSVFIIIGILLILFVGLALFIRSVITKDTEHQPEDIPSEFYPVKIFIEQCISRTASEAIQLIGESGGYTNLDEFGITHTSDPTTSQAVQFSPESSLNVAYWWYLKSPNDCSGNCEFSSEMPYLKSEYEKGEERSFMDSSIEAQIDRYVNENIDECLNDFNDFKKQGFTIIELGNVKTTTTIRDKDVLVSVDYPIEIKKGNINSKASKFFTEIPVVLKDVYELAFMITSDEINYHFLEINALNLISAFSDIDSNKLPPMAGSEFQLKAPVYWTKPDVETKLQEMLMSYVPLLQVKDTLNYRDRSSGDIIKDGIYEQMTIPSYGENYKRVASNFAYLGWWPTYFDINSRSGLIMPESASSTFLPLDIGIQRYDFSYDVSYPVIVTLNSPDSFNGQGYSFKFALEANIRNNQPMNSSFVSLESFGEESSMFCDANKRNSGDITIKAFDAQTKQPIDKVMVYYTCGEESCFIGNTEIKDNQAVLETKLPICAGGIITYKKPDYIGYSQFLSTEVDESATLPSVNLQPIEIKKIEVKKKNLVKQDGVWTFQTNPLSLSWDEQAIVSLERIGQQGEEEFTAVAEFKGGQSTPSEIRIAPGKYKVNIQLMLNSKVVIPERTERILGIIPIAKIPEIELEPYPAGGLIFDETNAFEIKTTNYNTLEFYSLYVDIPSIPLSERVHEDIEETGKIDDYSKHYRKSLEPSLR